MKVKSLQSRELTNYLNAKPKHRPFWLGQALRSIPNDALKPIAEALIQCRKGNRCKLIVCPTCGKSPAKWAGVTMLRHILAHFEAMPSNWVKENFFTGEVTPFKEVSMDDVSFVTINGPRCDSTDPTVIAALAESFSTRLKNVRRRYFNDTAWTINLEFSLGIHPYLHAHMLVYHRGYTRQGLAKNLRHYFKQPRAVMVSEWWKADRFANPKLAAKLAKGEYRLDDLNIGKATKYTAKPLPEIDNAEQATVAQIGRWILQTLALRVDGYKSSMFKFGIKKPEGSRWDRSKLVFSNGERKHFTALDIAREARKNKHGKELTKVIRRKKAVWLSDSDYPEGLEETLWEDIAGELRDDAGLEYGYDDELDNDCDDDWKAIGDTIDGIVVVGLGDTNNKDGDLTGQVTAARSIEPSPAPRPGPEYAVQRQSQRRHLE